MPRRAGRRLVGATRAKAQVRLNEALPFVPRANFPANVKGMTKVFSLAAGLVGITGTIVRYNRSLAGTADKFLLPRRPTRREFRVIVRLVRHPGRRAKRNA